MRDFQATSRRSVLVSVALFATSVIAGAGLQSTLAGEPNDPLAGRFGGPFALMSHEGRLVSDADFRGRFLLVFFGYTHCPDLCPAGLATMTAALEMAGPEAAAIQPLFITVDPDRDTAQVLAAYVKSFHPSLLGLTGGEAEIASLAKAYKVHRRKVLTPPAADPADYVVDHGSLTYLMGPDGTFRTLVPHNTPAERLAALLQGYVRAEATGKADAPQAGSAAR